VKATFDAPRRSRYSYTETVERLSSAIVQGGNTLFATIDQGKAAQSAGASLRPTTLLIFGNPKGGTPLMAAFPLVGLELPLKLLVWEEAGAAYVASMQMSAVFAQFGVTGFEGLAAAMDHALAALIAEVAG
jgi:uncharacterized protein (DUF302 family)